MLSALQSVKTNISKLAKETEPIIFGTRVAMSKVATQTISPFWNRDEDTRTKMYET